MEALKQPLPDPNTLDYQEIIRHINPDKEGGYFNDDLYCILSKILDVKKLDGRYVMEVRCILKDLGYTWGYRGVQWWSNAHVLEE